MVYILRGWTSASALNIPLLRAIHEEKLRSEIVDCMVQKREDRFAKVGFSVHLCSIYLPPDAIWTTSSGSESWGTPFCSSPELTYLQICSDPTIKILDAIRIACCFCASVHNQDAITSVAKMRRFIESVPRHPGRPLALRALRYAIDNIRSILEISVFMFLHLPYSLGGLGLPLPEANKVFQLNRKQRRELQKNFLIVDFIYEAFNFVIEYDSKTYHDNARSHEADAARAAVIESAGYTVQSIETLQIYDLKSFKKIVDNIRHHLRKRIRIRSLKFRENFHKLRLMLPRRVCDYNFDKLNHREEQVFFKDMRAA